MPIMNAERDLAVALRWPPVVLALALGYLALSDPAHLLGHLRYPSFCAVSLSFKRFTTAAWKEYHIYSNP